MTDNWGTPKSQIKRKARLESNAPVRKRRVKARPGRLKDEALRELRAACFARDNYRCQVCGCIVFPHFPPEYDFSAHMAHIQAKRRGGDSLSNVRTLCGRDHRISHVYGPSMTKPCPPKPRD